MAVESFDLEACLFSSHYLLIVIACLKKIGLLWLRGTKNLVLPARWLEKLWSPELPRR